MNSDPVLKFLKYVKKEVVKNAYKELLGELYKEVELKDVYLNLVSGLDITTPSFSYAGTNFGFSVISDDYENFEITNDGTIRGKTNTIITTPLIFLDGWDLEESSLYLYEKVPVEIAGITLAIHEYSHFVVYVIQPRPIHVLGRLILANLSKRLPNLDINDGRELLLAFKKYGRQEELNSFALLTMLEEALVCSLEERIMERIGYQQEIKKSKRYTIVNESLKSVGIVDTINLRNVNDKKLINLIVNWDRYLIIPHKYYENLIKSYNQIKVEKPSV